MGETSSSSHSRQDPCALGYGFHGAIANSTPNFFDQEGATYFGELEEAFMHQVASLRRTQAATTSTAHHGDATRKQLSACSLSSSQPLSLSGSDQDQENTQSFLSLAGQG
jgi:transcription factor TGA